MACRPAIDAPESIEEQAVFAFVHFDDAERVSAVADSILDFAVSDDPDLEEGFLVDDLSNDDLETVGVEAPDITGILGALGRAVHQVGPERVVRPITASDRATWDEGSDVWTVSDESGDRDCFVEQACGTYAQTVRQETSVPVLGTITRQFRNEMQWLTSESGRRVLAIRQLGPEPADVSSGLAAIDQQYNIVLIGETDTGAVRAESIWVDARLLGIELPERFAVRQAVMRMQRTADIFDAYELGSQP